MFERNGFYDRVLIFDGTPVTFNGSTETWNYGAPQYWYPGHEYAFVALYPDSVIEKFCIAHEYESPTLKLTLSFKSLENITDPEPIPDIIVASHRRFCRNEQGNDKIRLSFQHLMSRIDIVATVSDPMMYTGDNEGRLDPDPDFNDTIIKNEYIQFRRVKLSGFRPQANIIITPAALNSADRTDDTEITATVDETVPYSSMTLEFSEKTAKHIVNSGNDLYGKYHEYPSSLFDDNSGIMLLPQTLAPDAKLTMRYTVNRDSIKGEEDTVRTLILPLPTFETTLEDGTTVEKGLTLEFGKLYRLSFTVEDVYKGQIKSGSLKWTVTDINDETDDWVNKCDTIRQQFTVDND